MARRMADPRLMLMMFLQYAVWGAWLPIASRYLTAARADGGLGFNDLQVGLILGLAGSIGALCAPFIAGQFADRYFSAERFLGAMLLIGAAIQITVSYQVAFWAWLVLAIAYSVVYMPTLALSNSLTFAHLEDRERQFPMVRVWGTVGWIAASWVFPMVWLQQQHFMPGFLAEFLRNLSWIPQSWKPHLVITDVPDATARIAIALRFSGYISLAYGLIAFFLPHTPPRRDAVEKLAFARAFSLLRNKSFAVLFAVALPIAVIHQIYFLQTAPFFGAIGVPTSMIQPAMTIGQFAEAIVMALLGLMLTRLGFRTVIFMGVMCYVVRYAVFGLGTIGPVTANVFSPDVLPVWLTVSSQFLHGFCYACFFAASFIYVDRIAPPDVRHSAQTLYGVFILGLGPVLGGIVSGVLGSMFSPAGVKPEDMQLVDLLAKFRGVWLSVSAIALVSGMVFVALFRSAARAHGTALSADRAGTLAEAEQ